MHPFYSMRHQGVLQVRLFISRFIAMCYDEVELRVLITESLLTKKFRHTGEQLATAVEITKQEKGEEEESEKRAG